MKSSAAMWACLLAVSLLGPAAPGRAAERGVPILLYHRFGPVAADSMTVATPVFESHLKHLREHGYRIIPLGELLAMVFGRGVPADARDVALAADDAHISVYTTAYPLLKKYNAPMTLFIYPSAVSNASYAMTWDQLRELKAGGRFDFQSHTLWHPNFNRERRRLQPAEFDRFVRMQLTQSRAKIEKELAVKVDLLAWPFGIFDAELMARAAEAGYRAAFTIERRPASRLDHPMALPRYLLTDADRGRVFEGLLNAATRFTAKGETNGKAN
jgi:peptidoglycan/xylan/chitin deacetylase (PgdA/CDA1 family)